MTHFPARIYGFILTRAGRVFDFESPEVSGLNKMDSGFPWGKRQTPLRIMITMMKTNFSLPALLGCLVGGFSLLLAMNVPLSAQVQIRPVPATRTALVMGVWNYQDPTFPALPKKAIQNDLAQMRDKLTGLGFEVTVVENPGLKEAKDAVDSFGAKLRARGGASLFYFTGHGAEHEGKNFLIPAGTDIEVSGDLDDEALSANRILERMERSEVKVNLLFLDCCRNSLTKGGGESGLAPMTARGALIGFATRSGDVAQTSESGSLYTQALLKYLAQPGISLTDMHSLVTEDMVAQGIKGRPGQYADLGGVYHLVPAAPALGGLTPPAATPLKPLSSLFNGSVPKTLFPPSTLLGPANPQPSPNGSAPPTMNRSRLRPLSELLEQNGLNSATPPTATKDKPFINSLGMKFVPAVTFKSGKKTLFCIWKTRRQDYTVYAGANKGVDDTWRNMLRRGVPLGSEDDGPVAGISWTDANGFCTWLTQNERAAGRIGPGDEYRLPTDLEWSYAVGIGEKEDANATPEQKSGKIQDVYPWGTQFPPPNWAANLSDTASKEKQTGNYYISGYADGFATTSPVGRFAPNQLGIHDLAGNVMEWCQDEYFKDTPHSRVIRGSSWYTHDAEALLSSSRSVAGLEDRSDLYGFRCVLQVAAPKAQP